MKSSSFTLEEIVFLYDKSSKETILCTQKEVHEQVEETEAKYLLTHDRAADQHKFDQPVAHRPEAWKTVR